MIIEMFLKTKIDINITIQQKSCNYGHYSRDLNTDSHKCLIQILHSARVLE